MSRWQTKYRSKQRSNPDKEEIRVGIGQKAEGIQSFLKHLYTNAQRLTNKQELEACVEAGLQYHQNHSSGTVYVTRVLPQMQAV